MLTIICKFINDKNSYTKIIYFYEFNKEYCFILNTYCMRKLNKEKINYEDIIPFNICFHLHQTIGASLWQKVYYSQML